MYTGDGIEHEYTVGPPSPNFHCPLVNVNERPWDITMFHRLNKQFLWPFSIAMPQIIYQRVE